MDLWTFVFVQLCGWRYHPGYLREGAVAPSLEEFAAVADSIVAIIEKRQS